MSTETITFQNFDLLNGSRQDIYDIGRRPIAPGLLEDATPSQKNLLNFISEGVIPQMATASSHRLTEVPDIDNLGELIAKVGPAKELQNNIERVQALLGTDETAVDIARNWVKASGLLLPVSRSYLDPEQSLHATEGAHSVVAVIKSGVRNWMWRRTERLEELQDDGFNIVQAVLVGGSRIMKSSEGPDVEKDMTEADYQEEVLKHKLEEGGIPVTTLAVDTTSGEEVADAAAGVVFDYFRAYEPVPVVSVSNAGAWVQDAGQLRRALVRRSQGTFDNRGDQFLVVASTFPLGTGEEPTSTHQNPFSALGQIARNAQELARHV